MHTYPGPARQRAVGLGRGLEPAADRGARRGARRLRAAHRAAGRRRRRDGRADRRPHHAAGDVTRGRCAPGPATSPSCPAPEPGVLRVLAGDFNATLDHAALRAVLRTGLDGRRPARPAGGWPGPGARCGCRWPRLALDHVLVDPRIGVAAVDLVPVPGSDHRALVADLVLPPG